MCRRQRHKQLPSSTCLAMFPWLSLLGAQGISSWACRSREEYELGILALMMRKVGDVIWNVRLRDGPTPLPRYHSLTWIQENITAILGTGHHCLSLCPLKTVVVYRRIWWNQTWKFPPRGILNRRPTTRFFMAYWSTSSILHLPYSAPCPLLHASRSFPWSGSVTHWHWDLLTFAFLVCCSALWLSWKHSQLLPSDLLQPLAALAGRWN